MADPISLSGTAVGVISLGIQVTQSLFDYYQAVKSQSSDIKHTLRKLDNLTGLLGSLQTHVKARKFRSDEQDLIKKIESLIQDCEECLQELEDESNKFKQHLIDNFQSLIKTTARRVAYPFRKSTLEKLDEDIDVVVDCLKLALQLFQQEVIDRVQDDLEDIKTLLNLIRSSQVSAGLQHWLGAPDPTINFNQACTRRHPNTGLWLVKGDTFSTWLRSPGSFLWLRGFAGCGKSVLCSTAIQYAFRFRRSNPKVGIAFFFFTFNDESKQDASALLRSLILQLSAQQSTSSDLARLRDNHRQATPPDHALLNCLHQLVQGFTDVYILVDALDESPREKHREAMLQVIADIRSWNEDGLHLLVTSRNEIDIRDELDPDPKTVIDMKNDEVNQDIATFIAQNLRENRKYAKWKKHHDMIQEALTKKANGMSLAHCPPNQQLLQQLLHSLPDTLDETYARMLRNIPPELESYAQQMFTILCSAIRPLTEVQLLDALAVEPSRPCKFDATRRFDETSALEEICPGFIDISIDHSIEKPVVRIAHFSVQEFLEAERILRLPDIASFHVLKQEGHSHVASACLAFLTEPQTMIKDVNTRDHIYPFTDYAARYWTEHLNSCDKKAELELQALPLFLNLALLENWVRTWNIDDVHGTLKGATPHPLYYAALLGLTWTVTKILDQQDSDIDQGTSHLSVLQVMNTDGAGRLSTPLIAASERGHIETVMLLLGRGADVNGGKYSTALITASDYGHKDIVELLLNNGAKINITDLMYRTALCLASRSGHNEIVKILLENGADVNIKGGAFGTPLQAASSKGHKDIVKQLLKYNNNINDVNGLQGTALHEAVFKGGSEIVKLLLEKGADCNIRNRTETTAIQAASYRGDKEIVKLLLDHGADINATAGPRSLGTALQASSWNGFKEVVELLLKNGADIDAAKGPDGTALQAATYRNHREVVKLLIQNGANINISDGSHDPALHAASYGGEKEIVELMLDNGADVDLLGGKHGTALAAASAGGYKDIVKLMLEKGANVNLLAIRYDTALAAASREGHMDIVELLLENGAAINISGALEAASSRGNDDIIELLIDKGAIVDENIMFCGERLSRLSTTSYERHKKVVDLMIKKGTKVDLIDYSMALI